MPIPSVTKVENFDIDIDSSAEFVNSDEMTFQSRTGGEKRTISGIIATQVQGDPVPYNPASTYADSTDWVIESNIVYRPLPNELPIGPEAFDSAKWLIVQGYADAENTALTINGVDTDVSAWANALHVDDIAELRTNLAASIYGIGAVVFVRSTGGPAFVVEAIGSLIDDGGMTVIGGSFGAVRDTDPSYVELRWYEIVMDGTGESPTAQQSVVQSARDSLPSIGGEIRFPSGSCYFDAPVTGTDEKSILWSGTGRHDFLSGAEAATSEIVTDQAITLFDLGSTSFTNASGPTFKNLGFRDIGTTATGAVRLRRTSHSRFDGCCSKNFAATGSIVYYLDGTNDAGFLHEFHGCESRGCDNTLTMIEANATQWYGGYISGGNPGIELSGKPDEFFFSGSIDSCAVGILSNSDSLVTSPMARFEANTTAVSLTESNNKVDGFFNNNTTDVAVTGSGVSNILYGHRATGSLIYTSASARLTKVINKYEIVIPSVTVSDGVFTKRGSGIPQITTDQDNYDPSDASFWSISSSTTVNISGIGSPSDGRIIRIANNGSHAITFLNDTISTAANRILTNGAAVLNANGMIELIYDTAVTRWRVTSVR